MPKKIRYNGIVHNFPDDATDDEIRSVLESGEQPQIASLQAPTEPRTQEFNQQSIPYQSIMGAAPPELLERVKGLGQSIGQTGLTGINWLASMAGVKPIPTP